MKTNGAGNMGLDYIITNHSWQAIMLDESDTTTKIDDEAKSQIKSLMLEVAEPYLTEHPNDHAGFIDAVEEL